MTTYACISSPFLPNYFDNANGHDVLYALRRPVIPRALRHDQ